MNATVLMGIVAVLAGVIILIWPVLLNVIVGLALIVGGAYAIYADASKAGLA